MLKIVRNADYDKWKNRVKCDDTRQTLPDVYTEIADLYKGE